MDQLYHYPLSPACRKIRLCLAEYGHDVSLIEERYWEMRPGFLRLNPSGELPVLVSGKKILCGGTPVAEYLEEMSTESGLLPGSAEARAEIRRLVDWFDHKFAEEVSLPLIHQKIIRRFLSASEGGGGPEMAIVRTALYNIHYHLDYIGYLMERRRWLAGAYLSLADLTAAAHLSCLDYIGDIPWAQYPEAKQWYVKLKSRPSFRTLLSDHLSGMPPPRFYTNLDF